LEVEVSEFSHVDENGRASMVDIGGKHPQRRTARASGRIDLAPETVELIRRNSLKKGDVLAVAELAGIQAAKRTSELIPLCHPLQISHIRVKTRLDDGGVAVTGSVACIDRTGVEMEALTAVSVALLTVYDMCKAVDKNMRIGSIVLEEKRKDEV
jgi:cyclic pyranopterin phosphate synthase